MNFDFEQFKELCNRYDDPYDRVHGMLDLRNKRDRRAFTDYMHENGIKHTYYGETDPFVYVGSPDGYVYGCDDNFNFKTYTIQDFLLPEVGTDDILEFLGGE